MGTSCLVTDAVNESHSRDDTPSPAAWMSGCMHARLSEAARLLRVEDDRRKGAPRLLSEVRLPVTAPLRFAPFTARIMDATLGRQA